MRDLDQLEARVVHGRLEYLVSLPVAIGLLDDNRAFQQQAFQDPGDIELVVPRIAYAEGNVLEITEQREVGGFGSRGRIVCRHWIIVTYPASSQSITALHKFTPKRR